MGAVRFGLARFHFLPVEKSVDIVEQKGDKANDNGNIADVADACQRPKDNQDDVVCGIGGGEKRTSAECEIHGEKTGGHRNGTRYDIRGVKEVQDEIENPGNDRGGGKHQNNFAFTNCVHFHFRFISFVRIFQPGNQGKNRHGHCHAEISQHFAVVGESIGNDAVQQAENNSQKLSDGVTLRVENECGHADAGRGKGDVTFTVESEKREQNEQHGNAPEQQFAFGKIRSDFFVHKNLLPKKEASACTSSKT